VNSANFEIIRHVRFYYFCGLEYKEIHIKIWHVPSIHNWLHLDFFRFFETLKYILLFFENKELHVTRLPFPVFGDLVSNLVVATK
jgi:hypothetical protein